jgi:uncharacterized membrane protein
MRLRPIPITLLVAAFVVTLGAGANAAPASPSLEEELPPDEYLRGRVAEIIETRSETVAGFAQLRQFLSIRLLSGPDRGRQVDAEYTGVGPANRANPVRVGETVVIVKMASSAGPAYEVIDRYRLLPVGMILGFFFLLAILLGGIRGATSILGLVVTILVLAKFIVPRILAGQNPLAISLAGAFVIALLSIFLAHGLSRRTTIALVSTLLALAIGAFLSAFFVSLTRLFGVGTEEAFYLQLGPLEKLNLRGLLLGGIILGALGVLDDVTTAQAGAVDEISQANPNLRYAELYRRGLSVGREHITSLVNTLVLAYAGASLPLFLLFSLGLGQPLWVLLNSEFIVEEVVRTLVGSICLMLAVPITTTLAAYVFHRIRVVE